MNRTELAPSVFLNVLPMDKFKTDQLSVSFIMPLDERVASYASLLSFVLKTGCAEYPGFVELGRALDSLYGAQLNVYLRKKGDNHLLTLSLEYLDDAFAFERERRSEAACELLRKIIFEPLASDGCFDAAAVKREKKNLCDLIDARINDKRIYAYRHCGELTAEGQPYSVYECGKKEIVESIDGSSLYEFYRDYISRAAVEIFAFGRMDAAAVKKAFTPMFDSGRNGATPHTQAVKAGDVREYTERYPVEQAKLSLGFAIDTENIDYTALTLFNILYGASANSLLFMNVREKLSLCYYCAAGIEKLKSMMTVYSGVMPEKIETAKAEILAQLERLRVGDFSADELAAAKKTYVNNVRSMADSMFQTEDYAITQTLLGLPVDTDAVLKRIDTLAAEDVSEVARRISLATVYVINNIEGSGNDGE